MTTPKSKQNGHVYEVSHNAGINTIIHMRCFQKGCLIIKVVLKSRGHILQGLLCCVLYSVGSLQREALDLGGLPQLLNPDNRNKNSVIPAMNTVMNSCPAI